MNEGRKEKGKGKDGRKKGWVSDCNVLTTTEGQLGREKEGD